MTTTVHPSIRKNLQFIVKVLSDFDGAASAMLTDIGDRLGLYKAMYDFGKPITSQELANNTWNIRTLHKRWLANQNASGYITYDSLSNRYTLPIEHAEAIVDETNPAYIAGGFQILMSLYKDAPKIFEVFKTDKGVAWGDHDKEAWRNSNDSKPFANNRFEDNLNTLGRLLYAASTMVCVPASLSKNWSALGTQTDEPGISQVVNRLALSILDGQLRLRL